MDLTAQDSRSNKQAKAKPQQQERKQDEGRLTYSSPLSAPPSYSWSNSQVKKDYPLVKDTHFQLK